MWLLSRVGHRSITSERGRKIELAAGSGKEEDEEAGSGGGGMKAGKGGLRGRKVEGK